MISIPKDEYERMKHKIARLKELEKIDFNLIRQFKEILNQEGVEEIEAAGREFDPNEHEAIETQAGENDNIVARVVAKGYKIEDKVIRPAKVVVTKSGTPSQIEQEREEEKFQMEDQ